MQRYELISILQKIFRKNRIDNKKGYQAGGSDQHRQYGTLAAVARPKTSKSARNSPALELRRTTPLDDSIFSANREMKVASVILLYLLATLSLCAKSPALEAYMVMPLTSVYRIMMQRYTDGT